MLNKRFLQYAHLIQNDFYLQHSHTIAGQQRMKLRLKESSTDLSSMAYPKLPHEESMDTGSGVGHPNETNNGQNL